MIIDIRDLRLKGKTEQNFEFSHQPPVSALDIPGSAFSGDAKVKCLVEIYKDEVFISGTVSFSLTAPCSRCLEPASFHSTIEFDERFLPSLRREEAEDDRLVYDRDRIDLSQFIDELILTDMPLALLCKEDCLGLCHEFGANLNISDCGHDRRNND